MRMMEEETEIKTRKKAKIFDVLGNYEAYRDRPEGAQEQIPQIQASADDLG